MTDNVVKFPGVTEINDLGDELPLDVVLEAARERNLEDVIILGTKPNGEFYFATTHPDYMQILWDLERAKTLLMAATLGE